MGDANGFENGQDNSALDLVAGAISAMGIGGADVEICNVAGARSKR